MTPYYYVSRITQDGVLRGGGTRGAATPPGQTRRPQLPSAAEAGLNALISKLRKVLGAATIEGRSRLQLQLAQNSRIDLETAVEAAHRAESRVALEEWNGAWGPSLAALFTAEREFLPGEDAPWIDDQRRQMSELRLRALEAYAWAALGIGGTELPAAVRSSRQLIRIVPLRESGYQVLMRSLARQGNVAEALHVYTDLCERLDEQLGVSPSARSGAIYDELLRS